ncbi:MAG: 5'-nucleotidase C-terminal domain-containing protein [Gemmatimonadetes bacterium]|nr:5'-nucleotidase C-terminal domain-containing protein [Gemmatimonadota bacterium]
MPSLLAALAGALLLIPQARTASVPDTTTIVIAATTDVHGRATAWDYVADRIAPLGLVRVATVVDSLRRLHPGRVVLVDVGDLLQGNPFATYFARVAAPQAVHPIIELMNRMGYDAATPGNHEYNFGLEFATRSLAGARFPYLSANILREPGGGPALEPYVILDRAGVRVGITGATTPGVMAWDGPSVRGHLRFADVAQAVPPVIRQMRSEGADVTVLVAHAGLDGPSSYGEVPGVPPENAVAAALAAAPETDVAVIGHTHREIADSTVGSTLVVQPRNWAQSVAVVRLSLVRTGTGWRVARKSGEIIPLGAARVDTALARALTPAHDSVRAWATRPIGRSTAAMSARTARLEDTPVIDFINAVQRARTGAELSVTAAFDTAGGLPAGDIAPRDIESIYPYDNYLAAVRISGAELRAYLEFSARYFRGMGPDGPVVNDSVRGYNFDILSGAEYALDLSRPLGRRVVRLRVRERDVADTDSFSLAVNSYRLAGGGGYTMLAGAPLLMTTAYDPNGGLQDMLAGEIARRGTIHPEDYFVRNWELVGVRPSPDSILLRVLATNDLHGALESRVESWSNNRPVGGAAALGGMMNRLGAECGCPTIRLDGGDLMQGRPISTLTRGRSAVETFNAMGYAAAAVGNHEFDWSVDTLAARIRQARFAWLSANVRERSSGRAPPWAVPWRVVDVGSRRVAVVGYTSPGTTTSASPSQVARLAFGGARSLDSAIAAARGERPDFVIVVAHAGAFCERDGGCAGEIVDLAGQLTERPDLIVSGHTHSLVNTRVNGIPIVQARSGGTALGIVDFVRGEGGRSARVRVETVWADRERPDTAVARVVDEYRREAAPLIDRAIVTLARPLERRGDQYPLGNVVADAVRRAGRADVAVVNNTGIRAGLGAGTVTWGALSEVLPFENFVVRQRVSGAVLRRALEHAVGSSQVRAHVSGVRVRFDPTAPAGARIGAVALEDGRPVEETGRYVLAVQDFLAEGGSGFAMLRDQPTENTGVTDLGALIAHLRRLPQPIRAVPEERRIEGRAP